MELIEKFKIPGKQGPFYLKRASLEELFEWHREPGTELHRMRRLVQICLVGRSGKPVYTKSQLSKMEQSLGAARLVWLFNRCREFNELDLLNDLEGNVQDAEKN